MDDVSGVADVSKTFANFLTVSRKLGYNCVYGFHVIVPASQICQKISETNIFNFFPASVPHNTVTKIIQSNCILQSKNYVPARSLWFNRVFTDLANSHERHCLTIESGYIDKNGPGRYRSSADNPEKQVCYFNKPNNDGIYFKIEKVRGKTHKENFDAKRTLENGTSNARSNEFFDDSKSEQNGAGTKRYGHSFEHLYRKHSRRSARPKFLSGQLCRSKKKIKRRKDYSNTKVKTRNLLINVSYRRFKQSNFNKILIRLIWKEN